MAITNKAHKILHIVSAMNRGGAETLLMNVHRNLDRSKIQFDYVSHRPEMCDYDEEIVSLDGTVYRIPSLGQIGPLSYIKELKKIMGKTDYIAVHAHTDYQGGFAALAAKRAGIHKRICHSHSTNWTKGGGIKSNVTLAALRAIIKYSATDYCACSSEAARFLFGNTQRVWVLKNGIDIHQFIQQPDTRSEVRRELNIAPESKILGHIGKFSESKNHAFLLRVIKRMVEQGKDITAVLVGDGPLKLGVEREAKRLGIYQRIRFLGVREDIPRLMRAFDVFLFPSLFEGFGIVTLEAQGSGTPCIASDTVPKSTDLEIGCMSFINLEEPLEAWTSAIDKALLIERPSADLIKSRFLKSGFDIKQSIGEWLNVYGLQKG